MPLVPLERLEERICELAAQQDGTLSPQESHLAWREVPAAECRCCDPGTPCDNRSRGIPMTTGAHRDCVVRVYEMHQHTAVRAQFPLPHRTVIRQWAHTKLPARSSAVIRYAA